MPSEAVASMAGQVRSGAVATDGLNELEQALLRMLAQGMTNKEMAAELGLAEITVKSRLARLYRRFGVRTRTQLLSPPRPPRAHGRARSSRRPARSI